MTTEHEYVILGPSSGKALFDDGGDYAVAIKGDEKKIVAEFISEIWYGEHTNALLNARLFVAAEKMLEVCNQALIVHKRWANLDDFGGELYDLRKMAMEIRNSITDD